METIRVSGSGHAVGKAAGLEDHPEQGRQDAEAVPDRNMASSTSPTCFAVGSESRPRRQCSVMPLSPTSNVSVHPV